MKLGIVVVYLVDEKDRPLLELHLDRIERHTSVPYRIYGSANRLLPALCPLVEARADLEIVPCPDTELRGYEEHAYYLECLIPAAIRDGATHVVCLNVDSFPIRDGWAEELIGRLDENRVLAAVCREENSDTKPHPSCLLFPSSFFLEHRPRFLLTPEELASEDFQRYRDDHPVIVDTGIGYGLLLFREGLDWYRLRRSNSVEDHYILGSVYGGLVFHLGGASREAPIHIRERQRIDEARFATPTGRLWTAALRAGARVVPASLRRRLRPYLLPASTRRIQQETLDTYEKVRRQLLEDPDAYFERLGKPEGGGPSRPDAQSLRRPNSR